MPGPENKTFAESNVSKFSTGSQNFKNFPKASSHHFHVKDGLRQKVLIKGSLNPKQIGGYEKKKAQNDEMFKSNEELSTLQIELMRHVARLKHKRDALTRALASMKHCCTFNEDSFQSNKNCKPKFHQTNANQDQQRQLKLPTDNVHSNPFLKVSCTNSLFQNENLDNEEPIDLRKGSASVAPTVVILNNQTESVSARNALCLNSSESGISDCSTNLTKVNGKSTAKQKEVLKVTAPVIQGTILKTPHQLLRRALNHGSNNRPTTIQRHKILHNLQEKILLGKTSEAHNKTSECQKKYDSFHRTSHPCHKSSDSVLISDHHHNTSDHTSKTPDLHLNTSDPCHWTSNPNNKTSDSNFKTSDPQKIANSHNMTLNRNHKSNALYKPSNNPIYKSPNHPISSGVADERNKCVSMNKKSSISFLISSNPLIIDLSLKESDGIDPSSLPTTLGDVYEAENSGSGNENIIQRSSILSRGTAINSVINQNSEKNHQTQPESTKQVNANTQPKDKPDFVDAIKNLVEDLQKKRNDVALNAIKQICLPTKDFVSDPDLSKTNTFPNCGLAHLKDNLLLQSAKTNGESGNGYHLLVKITDELGTEKTYPLEDLLPDQFNQGFKHSENLANNILNLMKHQFERKLPPDLFHKSSSIDNSRLQNEVKVEENLPPANTLQACKFNTEDNLTKNVVFEIKVETLMKEYENRRLKERESDSGSMVEEGSLNPQSERLSVIEQNPASETENFSELHLLASVASAETTPLKGQYKFPISARPYSNSRVIFRNDHPKLCSAFQVDSNKIISVFPENGVKPGRQMKSKLYASDLKELPPPVKRRKSNLS